MRASCASVVALALLAPGVASLAQQSIPVAITQVSIVDVLNGGILANRTVVIKGDAIVSVSTGAAPRGARIIDGQGKFLIPGLWDLHTHMQATGAAARALHVAQRGTGRRDKG